MTKEYGAVFRELREQNGITQDVLAVKAGVGRGTIQRIENGKLRQASIRTLEQLLGVLNVSLIDFFNMCA